MQFRFGFHVCSMRFALKAVLTPALAGFLFSFHTISLRANPTGGSVHSGSASFSSSGTQFTITQTSPTALINWQSFNIGAGETTTFVQPSSTSLVWNKINDPNTSQILGNLNANGYVVLQNQNGFYIGGSAVINANGLIMTTASVPAPDLSGGSPWVFNAPPPAAKIINYGQINIGGGTSPYLYLIADDIENNGAISVPGGKVGLLAGQQVLLSTSPDGKGLSAKVTLPQGSVDNEGHLTADGGSIALWAQTVNQGGVIQANTAQSVNGVIELVASDTTTLAVGSQTRADAGTIAISGNTVNQNGSVQANSVNNANGVVEINAVNTLNLGASSVTSATGDSSATQASPGGFMTLRAGQTFNNASGSQISVSGQMGGRNGVVEVFGNNVTDASAVPSLASYAALFINPAKVTLSSSATSSSGFNLNLSDLANYTRINLYNIDLTSLWNLADSGSAAALNVSAGNSFTLDNNITAGKNWTLNLSAGTLPTASTPSSGSEGIYLNGTAFIQALNGDINLSAANEIIVHGGAVRTIGSGNINVMTEYGNVNTGNNTSGFNYRPKAPFYTPFSVGASPGFAIQTTSKLGGISTAAGGNVTITAGGDVTSYLPRSSDTGDPGAGAFGSQPGNVTISAGGNVYGHYVLVNGTGTITAGQNIGNAANNVALSLVAGSWNLDALNGNIYLQEVRNPNGVFNTFAGNGKSGYGSGGSHLFDYNSQAAVDLTAGNGVYITGQNLPRPSVNSSVDGVPMLLPPTVIMQAGPGGINLQTPGITGGTLSDSDIILFPSPYGDLQINTTGGGGFFGNGAVLRMSDSAQSASAQPRWFPVTSGSEPFSQGDHASTPPEINNPIPDYLRPVVINISGNMANVTLFASKEAQISVDGNMTGCAFYGENLNPNDTTSITVKGNITEPSSFTPAVPLGQTIANVPLTIANVPLQDLPPGTINNWETVLDLAINPDALAQLYNTLYKDPNFDLSQIPPSQYSTYLKDVSFGLGSIKNNFDYDSTDKTKTLTFSGTMSSTVQNELEKTIDQNGMVELTVIRYKNGVPEVAFNKQDGRNEFVTDQIPWVKASVIDTLASDSQGLPAIGDNTDRGFLLGGPGALSITANSISLGNSRGIVSLGNGILGNSDYSSLTPYMHPDDNTLYPGASIDVTVAGDLTMPASTIATLGGGNVTVTSTGGSMDLGDPHLAGFEAQIMTASHFGLGIYTSDGGNANVTAQGTINVDSSRIGTFDGGNIFVESFQGDVNAGSGGTVAIPVEVFSPLNVFLIANEPYEQVYANGIVAQTLVNPSNPLYLVPDRATLPGNITVLTPQGNIIASLGGILQETLNGKLTPGPTITLTAGSTGHDELVDLGQAGAIGGTVNVSASKVNGLVIAAQDANINAGVGGFNGTVLAGQNANVSSGGSISGDIIGGGGVNVSGAEVTATLLGQNVSENGGASQSTLGTATATATSQSAAGEASDTAKQQVASNDTGSGDSDQQKKKGHPALHRVGRVTVLLPRA